MGFYIEWCQSHKMRFKSATFVFFFSHNIFIYSIYWSGSVWNLGMDFCSWKIYNLKMAYEQKSFISCNKVPLGRYFHVCQKHILYHFYGFFLFQHVKFYATLQTLLSSYTWNVSALYKHWKTLFFYAKKKPITITSLRFS